MAACTDSSPALHVSKMEYPRSAKQDLEGLSKVEHKGAAGKSSDILVETSTMETMPTLSDLLYSNNLEHGQDAVGKKSGILSEISTMETMPALSDVLDTNNLESDHGSDDEDSLLDDIGHIDVYDFLDSEPSADEGRRCDIQYSESDCMPFCSENSFDDPLLSELPAEPIASKHCLFLSRWKQSEKAVNGRKASLHFGTRSSDNAEDQTGPEAAPTPSPSVRLLKACQSKDVGMSSHRSCARPQKRMTAFDSRSLTLNYVPVDTVMLDEAVEMDTFAGAPGRALRKSRATNFEG
mmetsp:Transcript_51061/g.94438  ORF Transcript_51061/g.94438 Transcript_51061/m.94438 type:complete len:294 (-) Transcript_51061:36-917(-)